VIGRRRSTGLLALLGAVLCIAVPAQAELSANGNLFITFSGGLSPTALPRDSRAPISVLIAGKVRTLKGKKVPALSKIRIALNRAGRLDTRGLPNCPRRMLDTASSREALLVCGQALVGSGTYRARTTFPEHARSPSHGKILAFNSTSHGHPTILAQVYGTKPVRSTNVIVFQIRRRKDGPFGTVMTGTSPPGLTRWGYLKRISLTLHRTYTYRGRQHSYLSAPCEAPPGLDRASFKFAFASMTFADGRELSSVLTRTCRVKKGG